MKIAKVGLMVVVVALASATSMTHAKGRNSSKSESSSSATPKEHSVSGYTRSNGTQVRAHDRSNPDGARNNNWTTEGNTNPHTGKDGTLPRSQYERSPKK